jgi:hypothetical protein
MSEEDLVTRLRKRAEIRRQIGTRKSVQEGKPDRLADLLDEAAAEIQGSHKYGTFEDWFDELEKFSFRSERFFETMSMYSEDEKTAKTIEWLRAAFECGRMKK